MMKIRIPNSWKDIRVDKFPLIYDIVRDSDIDENERNYRVLSILADCNLSDIKKIKLSELKKLIDSIQYIFKFEFPKNKQTFKHNKIHYKINYDVTQLNAEDFITLSKLTENEDTIINNLPQIVAVFVKPFQYKWFKKVEIEMDYNEIVSKLKDVDIGTIYPIAVFFCQITDSLLENIEDYLESQSAEVMKILNQELTSELKNRNIQITGDGT